MVEVITFKASAFCLAQPTSSGPWKFCFETPTRFSAYAEFETLKAAQAFAAKLPKYVKLRAMPYYTMRPGIKAAVDNPYLLRQDRCNWQSQ